MFVYVVITAYKNGRYVLHRAFATEDEAEKDARRRFAALGGARDDIEGIVWIEIPYTEE